MGGNDHELSEPLLAMEPLLPLHATIDIEEEEALARERHYSILDRSSDTAENDTAAAQNESFLKSFFRSKGPPQVIFLCMLLAL